MIVWIHAVQHKSPAISLASPTMVTNSLSGKPSSSHMKFNGIKPIKYTRWLLTILGIWPSIKRHSTATDQFLAIIVRMICYFLGLFTITPGIYYMFYRKATDPKDRLALFGPVGFFTMVTLKYTVMLCRQRSIKKCIEHIETDWQMIESQEEYDIVLRNFLISRKITIICASFMYSGGLSYHAIIPFVIGAPVTVQENRPLVIIGYDDVFDVYTTPVYHLVFLSHCLCAFVMYTVTVSGCNLAASFVTHACSQIQIVIMKLNDLVGYGYHEYDESQHNKLKAIVMSHVRVQRYAIDIEIVLREICLVEILTSGIFICWLEYCVLKTWDESEALGLSTYFMLLVSLTFNIFIFCYIGELLKSQWNEAGTSAYLLEWYNFSPKLATSLIMIISVSQIPKKITAGGMMELTYSSFLSVMKSSVVYLNILRHMDL